jgi:CHAT domain-containing protein
LIAALRLPWLTSTASWLAVILAAMLLGPPTAWAQSMAASAVSAKPAAVAPAPSRAASGAGAGAARGDDAAELAQQRQLDAESLLRVSDEGKALYERDTVKLDGYGYCGQSFALAERGELRQSIRAASKALHLGQDQLDDELQGLAQRDLAIAYSYAGLSEAAERYAQAALALKVRDEAQIHAPVLKVLGDLALRRSQPDQALALYRRSLDLATPRYRGFVAISMANAQVAAGQPQAALVALGQVNAAARVQAGAYYLRSLGKAQLAAGQPDAAIASFEQVLADPKQVEADYHGVWALNGLANARLAKGDRNGALAAWLLAVQQSDNLRARFRSEEFKSGLFGDLQTIFDSALALSIEQADYAAAWQLSEAARSRQLLDTVRQRAADKLPRVTTLAALQAGLAPDEAVLEYHVLDKRLLAWLIRPGKLEGRVIEIPAADLRASVERFRAAIIGRRAAALGQSQALYTQLIAPFDLTGVARLDVVAHGPLHYLPFQALHDGKVWLIEKVGVASWPSAALGSYLAGRRDNRPGALLAFGNPSTDLNVPLPGAEREVQQISALFNGANVFMRGDATRGRFTNSARSAGVLHVAAHAEVDAVDAMSSRILMASSLTDPGLLEARDVFGLDLSGVRLVTLSACESALGQVARGDEILGFTRSFFAAGAHTLIASLWPVADDATQQLMVHLYRDLAGGADAMSAMRAAQIDVMHTRGQSHPFFWAPFNLIGDGALRLVGP